jgi:hypothetical protein
MTPTCKRVTIFEGPDGGGKSYAARDFAAATNARLVHCGPFPGVTKGLARLYVEAMLPALLGYEDVVLDRCWLSEPIYGAVMRGGRCRLTAADVRMLERVALRCGAQVVLCHPGFEACREAYVARRCEEYLERTEQLEQVCAAYDEVTTALPLLLYSYRERRALPALDGLGGQPHPLASASAGSLAAPVVLVGEALAARKDHDPLLQLPFVSFSGAGCSRWLTDQLEAAGADEEQLLWLNADDKLFNEVLHTAPRRLVVGLGLAAGSRLAQVDASGVDRFEVIGHPQHAKRFHHRVPYRLVTLLKEVCHAQQGG